MFNSTDLKDSNNSIYGISVRPPGIDAIPGGRWFLVKDLGASPGETGRLYPRRDWIAGFEEEPFITHVSDQGIEFGYEGRHQELLAIIGPEDVLWAARQMLRLSDAQWRDAFRAANYTVPQAERYIARIKEKMSDGLARRVDRRAGQPR